MPDITNTPISSLQRPQQAATGRRQAFALIVGFAAILAFTVTGCRTLQPAAPLAESPTPTAPPVQVPISTDTASLPAAAAPPSGETGRGATQDGRPLAARVNGQPIFLDIYEKQVAQTEQAMVEQGRILYGEEGQAQLAQIRQSVLNSLIEQAIIGQAAATAGIVVTDEELEETVQESIALGQGQESFDQWLAENNMTMEEFRETQRSQLLAGKMIEYITASVPTTAEQVHARHIRTSDPNRAQALLDELTGGANFAALAQRESEDAATAANGGDLGWFPRDVPLMPPQVVEAAFALQPGEISHIVESELGYHIIKVEAREANRPLTPEMLLYARKYAFEKWLAEQWAEVTIERYIEL